MKRGPKKEGFLYAFSTTLNPRDNGGEAVSLGVEIFKEPNEEPTQTLVLETCCYGTHSSRITIPGVTLEQLEKAIQILKNELETTMMVEQVAREAQK